MPATDLGAMLSVLAGSGQAVGLALMLLGLGLLVAEALVLSYGILGVVGVLSVLMGAGMLFDGAGNAWLEPSFPLVAGMGLALLAASILVLRLALRNRKLRSQSGTGALVGQPARVLDWSDAGSHGHVLLAGERWQARGNAGLQPGQQVRVVAVQGLRVEVTSDAASEADPNLPSPTL